MTHKTSKHPHGLTSSVTQAQLHEILELRAQDDALQAQLKKQEDDVIRLLQRGSSIEPGPRTASLRRFERRRVPWKAVVERKLGKPYAARVLAATRPETFAHLVILPSWW